MFEIMRIVGSLLLYLVEGNGKIIDYNTNIINILISFGFVIQFANNVGK